MKDIRVDGDGEFRCWNCGNKGLLAKRTFRAKMLVGVGALLTKKKLKCQTCGEYNDTGNAKPFTGPEDRKWRKAYEQQQAAKSAATLAAEQRAAELAAQAFAAELAAEAQAGTATPQDFLPPTAPLSGSEVTTGAAPPPPPPVSLPTVPASWQADPVGRHQMRFWDGQAWTAHVSNSGVAATDPI
jgi:hypothetical protein